MMYDREKVDRENIFYWMTLLNSSFRTDKRKWYLTQHTTNLWNPLPQDVIMAMSVDDFKKGIG